MSWERTTQRGMGALRSARAQVWQFNGAPRLLRHAVASTGEEELGRKPFTKLHLSSRAFGPTNTKTQYITFRPPLPERPAPSLHLPNPAPASTAPASPASQQLPPLPPRSSPIPNSPHWSSLPPLQWFRTRRLAQRCVESHWVRRWRGWRRGCWLSLRRGGVGRTRLG